MSNTELKLRLELLNDAEDYYIAKVTKNVYVAFERAASKFKYFETQGAELICRHDVLLGEKREDCDHLLMFPTETGRSIFYGIISRCTENEFRVEQEIWDGLKQLDLEEDIA